MNPILNHALQQGLVMKLRMMLVPTCAALALCSGLSGCATLSSNLGEVGSTVTTKVVETGSKVGGAVKENLHAVADALTDDVSPDDPIEPVNRVIYKFNDVFDRYLLQPVAKGYAAITPTPVRACVRNIFSNVGDIPNALNGALQGKLAHAASDMGRFMLNSTAGIFGCFDVASEAGLEKHKEDFGQTLGVWGVPAGPYLMLPFLGPSTVRDAFGTFTIDNKTNAIGYIDHIPTRNETYALSIIDLRASLLDARGFIRDAALDPYVFLREAYLGRRKNQIEEGDDDFGNGK